MYFLCPDHPVGYGPRIFVVDCDEPTQNTANQAHQYLTERCCWGGSDKTIEAPTKESPYRVFRGYEFPAKGRGFVASRERGYDECVAHLKELFGEPITREQVREVF